MSSLNRPYKDDPVECSCCKGLTFDCATCGGSGVMAGTENFTSPMTDEEWLEDLEERVQAIEERARGI